ncbi:MAG TPA: KH domain-containing protein [Acidobacteriaceae bacterium]|nr:KH domain-containing protein [Acidobacteriaceae bacterium]
MQTPDRPDDMRELIAQIARALVDIPGEVQVEEQLHGDATNLALRVARSDVGKVIGKQGRTARSMRTILAAVSMKHRHRYTLDILEEEP